MFIAELNPGFGGKEMEIRQSWLEESHDPSTEFEFEGNTIRAKTLRGDHARNWDAKSFQSIFEIAVHRVLPGCEIIWRS